MKLLKNISHYIICLLIFGLFVGAAALAFANGGAEEISLATPDASPTTAPVVFPLGYFEDDGSPDVETVDSKTARELAAFGFGFDYDQIRVNDARLYKPADIYYIRLSSVSQEEIALDVAFTYNNGTVYDDGAEQEEQGNPSEKAELCYYYIHSPRAAAPDELDATAEDLKTAFSGENRLKTLSWLMESLSFIDGTGMLDAATAAVKVYDRYTVFSGMMRVYVYDGLVWCTCGNGDSFLTFAVDPSADNAIVVLSIDTAESFTFS